MMTDPAFAIKNEVQLWADVQIDTLQTLIANLVGSRSISLEIRENHHAV